MIGYKAFNNDMTCRDFQYKIGQQYEIDEIPKVCSQGFHFCKNLEDVFNYYPFSKKTKVCKVKAYGDIDTSWDGIKFCTNKIKIQEEINFNHLFQFCFHKKITSDSIDLSTIEIGTKIPMKNNHTLVCVSIQNNKYIFAFDEAMVKLPVYEICSFIRNLDNFKDWLPSEWFDSISEIFIPNEYEVYGNYFWCVPKDEPFLPFVYYKYKQNRMKYMNGNSIFWWLSKESYFGFTYVNSSGNVESYDASFAFGVVPHFIIKR